MSDGNRSKLGQAGLAIAAVASLATGLGLYGWTASEQAEHQIAAERDAQYEAASASERVKLECAISDVPAAECNERIEHEAQNAQEQTRDLEAQQTMAVWTRAMGIAAIIGMAVGILGLGLIFFTFRETRRAADSAEKSYTAFVKFESAIIDLGFAKEPRFFIENGEMHIRFELTCTNIGRGGAFVNGLHIQGQELVSYSFILKAGGESHLAESFKTPIPENSLILIYVQYSTHIEFDIRRECAISVKVAEKPGDCRATIFAGGTVRPGDKVYHKPFQ